MFSSGVFPKNIHYCKMYITRELFFSIIIILQFFTIFSNYFPPVIFFEYTYNKYIIYMHVYDYLEK